MVQKKRGKKRKCPEEWQKVANAEIVRGITEHKAWLTKNKEELNVLDKQWMADQLVVQDLKKELNACQNKKKRTTDERELLPI